MKKLFSIILLGILSINVLTAKEISGTVSGTFADGKKEKLASASIKLMHSKKIVRTDKDGHFKFELQSEHELLIVSYPGYRPDTLHLEEGHPNHLDFLLYSDAVSDAIIIEARKLAMINKADAFSTTTLTTHTLHKAACCNLSESFETNAAVDVSYSDAVTGAKQIEMLGLKGVYIQLLTTKIPNLRGLAAPYGLSYIPAARINAINISKGASSVSTGHESITGQINIDYKKPHNSEELYAEAYAAAHGGRMVSVNYLQNISKKLNTIFFVSGEYSDQINDENDDGFLDLPNKQIFTFMNKWHWQGDHDFGLFGLNIISNEMSGGQTAYLDDKKNSSLYGLEIDTKRYELFGKRAYIFGKEKNQSVALIASTIFHEQKSMYGHRYYDAKQTSGFMNLIYDYSSEHSKIFFNTGLSLEYDKYEEKLSNADFNEDTTMINEYIVPGAFVEYTFNLFKDVRVVSGVRGDYDVNGEKLYISPRIHTKYEFWPDMFLRASAGRGWRKAAIIAENTGILASSRRLIFANDLQSEDAWNYGINLLSNFELFNNDASFSVEYFRTDFVNQIIVDLDASTSAINIYNLDGQSYSNSIQFDFSFKPFRGFDVVTAYRYNDVKIDYQDGLIDKPLVSPHRGFVNLEYNTNNRLWSFDFTASYVGSGRLPNTSGNPEEFRLADSFDPYYIFNAQIKREIGDFILFLGVENIGNYTQKNPIISAENPYGEHFDSSIIYAPIIGRKVYLKVIYQLW